METLVKSTIYFGEFALDPLRRVLEKDGETVHLNSKALDLLLVLIENRGEIVEKNELLDKVWANQFVEENNLSVHVAALRKALGDKKGNHRHIVTVPGRGYSFVAVVEEEREKGRKGEGEKEAVGSGSRQSAVSEEQRTKDKGQRTKPLVGRTREISEIENLLRGDENRLITLTGAGGSGKTSLARTVGNSLEKDFADGVFFIELAALNNPELVASAIAKTLGVEESGSKSLTESLVGFLSERRTLLVLDNFEQILDAAPLLQKILDSTAFLKILVTSRAVLHLNNEREIVVTPLALPPIENNLSAKKLSEYAAIELFVRRAKSARQNFALNDENASDISEICRKLDGLPLAIELAAARVKLLSPESILERLENSLNLLTSGAKDLPERQRTMRGAVQWSYELLDESEQILFRRLAVFAGGFTVEAAEKLCEKDAESKFLVLDILTNLIENSLLVQIVMDDDNLRLRMLEVVREFALEMLEKSGELEELRQLHTQYFLALAEKAEPFLMGETGNEWLGKLENEHDNFRSALVWSLKNDGTAAAGIAAALRFFWLNHSHLSEGFRWSKAALEKTENSFSEARSKLLLSNGLFLRQQGKSEEAREMYEKILSESKELNDLSQIIKANHGLAAIAVLHKDFALAQSFIEEALTLSRDTKDEMQTAFSLCSLGDLEMSRKNLYAARPLLEECLTISKKLTNNRLLTTTYFNLGTIDYLENRYESAAFNFAESMRIAQEMGNKTMISCALDGFAALAATAENAVQSAELAGAADGLREFIGFKNEPAEEIFRENYLAKTRAALDPKVFTETYEKGRNLDLSEAVGLAESSISETCQQDTEIIVETHKFERVFIDEEIEEYENEPKLINEISVSSNEKTSRSWLKKHLAAIITAILILTAIGGVYVWQRGQIAKNSVPFQQISIKRLTNDGKVGRVAISPDGKLFAYSSTVPNPVIRLGHIAGGEPIELRPAADVSYNSLRFSPDSNTLYYVAESKEYPNGALFRLPVFGGVPEKLRENITANITFSPDMSRFAYVDNIRQKDTSTLFIADTNGASETALVSRPAKLKFGALSPAWSSDGKTIAVSAANESETGMNYEVFTVSADDGQIKQLTRGKFRFIPSLAWTGDGSGLVMTADKQPLADRQLWYVSFPVGDFRQINPDLNNYGTALEISADGDAILTVKIESLGNIWIAPTDSPAQAEQITFSTIGSKNGWEGLEWMPDGQIVYAAVADKSQSLWTINTDGNNQKQITPDGFIDRNPSVTADGRTIVFDSNRSGTLEIWRVNNDGGDLRQLTFDGNNEMADVSPDGKWVIYISTHDGLNNLRRIPLEGGEAVKISDKFASWVRVSPDSQFIACGYEEGEKLKLAVLPIDGGEPVKLFDLPPTANLRLGLRWTPDGKTLTYRDWENGYWRQTLDGGAAQRIENLPEEKLFSYDWSPDGKQFAFTRGQEIRDVVLIRNAER